MSVPRRKQGCYDGLEIRNIGSARPVTLFSHITDVFFYQDGDRMVRAEGGRILEIELMVDVT